LNLEELLINRDEYHHIDLPSTTCTVTSVRTGKQYPINLAMKSASCAAVRLSFEMAGFILQIPPDTTEFVGRLSPSGDTGDTAYTLYGGTMPLAAELYGTPLTLGTITFDGTDVYRIVVDPAIASFLRRHSHVAKGYYPVVPTAVVALWEKTPPSPPSPPSPPVKVVTTTDPNGSIITTTDPNGSIVMTTSVSTVSIRVLRRPHDSRVGGSVSSNECKKEWSETEIRRMEKEKE